MALIEEFLTDKQIFIVIIRIALILLITYAASKLYRKISTSAKKERKIHHRFFQSIITVCIYAAGIIIALLQLPYDGKLLEGLLAGSGIVALAISFAAQESLSNTISGMFISMFRPFEVGDRIHLISGNITGYIEDITLRHTVVRTFINSRVIVPNSVINKEMIENSNYWDGMASSFIDVTITYASDLEMAEKVIQEAVSTHPHFVDTRPADKKDLLPLVKVYVRALTTDGVELRVSMWTDDVGNNFDACSDVRKTIKLKFDTLGIHFAFNRNLNPDPTLSE